MYIDRYENQGGMYESLERIKFVLDRFEKYDDKYCRIYNNDVIPFCTVEEILGALISAEQVIKEMK